MARNPQERLDARYNQIENADIAESDREAILNYLQTYDPDKFRQNPPKGESTKARGTLADYGGTLLAAAQAGELTDADDERTNGLIDEWYAELAESTVQKRAIVLSAFHGWADTPTDPENVGIPQPETQSGSFDPDDVLTPEERDELLDGANSPRDRAVVATLIYTGMRNGCIRRLKWKDIDLDADEWTVPDETDGLKGLEKRGNRRPLLGAAGPLREWKRYHPDPSPDHYVITGKPRYSNPDPTTPVHSNTIGNAVEKAVEGTENPEIDRKPTHPHMLRHAFVTMCVRQYDMDDGDIKWLLGHAKGSKVMETTYAHLSDRDRIERVKGAAGDDEPTRSDAPLTPASCGTCGNPLPAGASRCPFCSTDYDPRQAGTAQEGIQAVLEAQSNGDLAPEMMDALAEKVAEKLDD